VLANRLFCASLSCAQQLGQDDASGLTVNLPLKARDASIAPLPLMR
jgi:hypothetical protein